ncbi:MAG: winged helix-turn-helix transcriptional regulator [Candidatus ainarchaeum sp.]|nr:winged helix-turn-helix transcriptional regulator [Candidatus ainarchaeum sp.]MDD5095938.1 winged helix-turn-helix transcriptional regulator [Candidatus ainarchaeum sp.]
MMDRSDLRILHMLLKDSRMSLSRIAKELGMSQPAAQKRIEKLKSKGIIVGSTVLLNERMIGWKRALVVLNADRRNYLAIIESVKKMHTVTAVYQATGPYGIGIELVGPAGVVNGVIAHIGKMKGVRDFCPISLEEKVI